MTDRGAAMSEETCEWVECPQGMDIRAACLRAAVYRVDTNTFSGQVRNSRYLCEIHFDATFPDRPRRP